MAIIKCKMCGGDLVLEEGSNVAECEYCGSRQTVPSADNEKKLNLFARANRLRANNEFDKASGVYESIVADFPEEAEAYWGLILCKYGIEYVDDPGTGKKIPTCHRSSFDSVLDDPNFELVMEYADPIARRVYREEAKQLEELRKGIIEVSSKEEPYDIFICYKETSEDGQRTLDSVLAQDVYDMLTENGYRVFFSRVSLEDKLGVAYEPYIFAALNSAKIMLAFGTDYEYYNAVWVKNEWSRFLQLIAKGEKKVLIPCYKNIDAYDMPKEFAKLQAQDLGKVGANQDLLRGIRKILPKDEPKTVKETVVVRESTGTAAGPTTANLLRRGNIFLEERNWDAARDYFNKFLDIDAENAEAYLGLALTNAQCSNLDRFVRALSDRFTAEAERTLPACEPDAKRIDAIANRLVVPGYLEQEEIKEPFVFALNYPSREAAAGKNKESTQAALRSDRNYARAKQYADSAMKEKLQKAEKQINDACDSRIEAAKKAAEAAKADVIKRYKTHLSEQEKAAEEKSAQAQEKREADYQEALSLQQKAETPEQYEAAAGALQKLGVYQDCEERAKTCREESSRLRMEAIAEQQRIHAAKKKKQKRVFFSITAAALLLIAGFFLATKVIIPASKYSAAEQLLEEGKYDEAAEAFQELADYKDSPDRKKEADYQNAEKLFKEGEYRESASAYSELGTYKDSAERKIEADYQNAAKLFKEEKYSEAVSTYKAISDYKDSKNKLNEASYKYAEQLFASEKYREAADLFAELGDYEDSANQTKESLYMNAVQLSENGKIIEAYESFISLNDYKDSPEKAKEYFTQYKFEKLKTLNVGDYAIFGTYEQDNNTSNGKEDIEWLVLEKDGNKLLLISRYALDRQKFNIFSGTLTEVTWETCSLRKWLNKTFVDNAFNVEEQKVLQRTTVTADRNPSYSTDPGNSTTDKVFLLSINEANSYFSTDDERQCEGTAYCYALGVAKADNGNCWWWLRSPGMRYFDAANVTHDGSIHFMGDNAGGFEFVDGGIEAVRPAIWITLEP